MSGAVDPVSAAAAGSRSRRVRARRTLTTGGRVVASGVTLAVVLVACLPGAAVLVVSWLRATRPPERARRPRARRAVHA